MAKYLNLNGVSYLWQKIVKSINTVRADLVDQLNFIKKNKIDTINIPSGKGEEIKNLTGSAVAITYDSELNENSINALLNKAIDAAYKELKEIIDSIPRFNIKITTAEWIKSPSSEISTSTIYLVPELSGDAVKNDNIFAEYIYIQYKGIWKFEKLGTQKVDLSNYATKTETRFIDKDQTEVLLNSLFTKAWKDSIDADINTLQKTVAKLDETYVQNINLDELVNALTYVKTVAVSDNVNRIPILDIDEITKDEIIIK